MAARVLQTPRHKVVDHRPPVHPLCPPHELLPLLLRPPLLEVRPAVVHDVDVRTYVVGDAVDLVLVVVAAPAPLAGVVNYRKHSRGREDGLERLLELQEGQGVMLL